MISSFSFGKILLIPFSFLLHLASCSPQYQVEQGTSAISPDDSTHQYNTNVAGSVSDLEALHRSLSETLTEMQDTLHEIKQHDPSDIIYQMSYQVSDLTARVQDLQSAKVSLEMKVNTLEAEMNCIMGRAGGCDPSKCLNGGTQVNGECQCLAGYTGAYCEKDVNECETENPCHNNGKCENSYGAFTCTCQPNNYGDQCQYEYDDCDPNPCGHGACVSMGRVEEGVPRMGCWCEDGWEIDFTNYTCSKDINECEDEFSVCDETSVGCTNTPGSYVCHCPPGYMGSGRWGEGCIEQQDCSSSPCRHGKCIDTDQGFECECYEGWTGHTCQKSRDSWCDTDPCRNGGRCIDLEDGQSFECECEPGYRGTYCESSVVCERVTCHNGGTCVTEDNVRYTCACRDGFGGTHCEGAATACDSHSCANGGECKPSTEGYTCECMAGFEGEHCRDKVLYELSTCGNQGTDGPSQRECENSYSGYQHDITVMNGIQNVYIPSNGTYRITAQGASGGGARRSGKGALISAVFSLTPGFLKVAVGQEGQCDEVNGKKHTSLVCGGGGGTFVVRDGAPLLVAGGGGGGGDDGEGLNGNSGPEGTAFIPNNNVHGGANGNGGGSCARFGGGGGGGFIGAGVNGYSSDQEVPSTGGKPWPNLRGGVGDLSIASHGQGALGGYGGGGRGTWSPGGGGGYSGGAGKCAKRGKNTSQKGGGGGGSFVSPQGQSRSIAIARETGAGLVTVVRLSE